MSCHIRCDPPHFQNSCSMPFFGLTFLVYRVQFVNGPQMNGKKSSKIHPNPKLQNFDSLSHLLELGMHAPAII